MRVRLQWLAGAALITAIGAVAALSVIDHGDFGGLRGEDRVASPGDGRRHGEHRGPDALEVDEEESEKADADGYARRAAVEFPLGDFGHGTVLPWTAALARPLDSVAAHAARGPPEV